MKHGGDLSEAIARYGGQIEDWLDLSTGINPNPWPVARQATPSLQRLPSQADLEKLLSAARAFFKVPDGIAIVAAPGVQTLIQWLPVVSPDGTVAILGPTYSEHSRTWALAGRMAETLSETGELQPTHRHLVIVNPNNPDGRLLCRGELRHAAAMIAERDGWLVVDESFIETMPEHSAVGLCTEFPLLVFRSFGKFFGLPGLRLGFLVAQEKIAARFRERLGPWPVSSDALAIGAQAYADLAWAAQTRSSLAAMARKLDAVLTEADLTLIGGTDLFRLVSTPDAQALHAHLARRHIWCRSFDHDETLLRFGLPGSDADLERLRNALRHKEPHI